MEANGADGYTAADLAAAEALAAAATPPAKTQRKGRKVNKDAVCPFCHLKGHSTKRSTQCLYHKDKEFLKDCEPPTPVLRVPMSLEEADRVAREDMIAMDAMDLDNDDVSVDVSLSLYEDAGTWSDDEDEDIDGLITGGV
jgi:hypothetical protein